MKHGKASTYQQHGCRCDECRSAATASKRAWRLKNGLEPSNKVQGRATTEAAKWVKQHRPELWAEFIVTAREQLNTPPPKRGALQIGPTPNTKETNTNDQDR